MRSGVKSDIMKSRDGPADWTVSLFLFLSPCRGMTRPSESGRSAARRGEDRPPGVNSSGGNTAMEEYWDLYDGRLRPTGRTHPRRRALAYGDYHLVVFAWALREDGRVLMTRRAPQKSYSGFYECTGGCAFAGETPALAATRELREETGLELENPFLARVCRRVDDFAFTYIFRAPLSAQPRPQSGETVAPEWLTPDRYAALLAEGRVVPSASNLPALLDALNAGRPLYENLLAGTCL